MPDWVKTVEGSLSIMQHLAKKHQKKTRLISIMSKLIKVMVVVAVIVFVKKVRSKKLLIKKKSMPKNIRLKSVGSKNILGKKKFWYTNFR